MAACYALEARSPRFVLLFAGFCLASSAYAAAIASWPFTAIELLWAFIAWRRYLRAPSTEPDSSKRGDPHDEPFS